MKKMFFPKSVNTAGTDKVAGKVNEVEETPGSVNRWLVRGCTIVEEEEKEVEPEVEAEKEVEPEVEAEKEVEPEVKKPAKTKKKKSSKK